MSRSRTLTLDLADWSTGEAPALPRRHKLRQSYPSDLGDLGRLYYESYPPGAAADSLADATADVVAAFGGDYGEFWFEASLLVVRRRHPVAAIMTVRRAPWEDVPDGPFVIELFTHPDHRRQGFARHLIDATASFVASQGERRLSLRVSKTNAPARRLYRSMGFVEV